MEIIDSLILPSTPPCDVYVSEHICIEKSSMTSSMLFHRCCIPVSRVYDINDLTPKHHPSSLRAGTEPIGIISSISDPSQSGHFDHMHSVDVLLAETTMGTGSAPSRVDRTKHFMIAEGVGFRVAQNRGIWMVSVDKVLQLAVT
jgi:hypothetical protein